MCVCVRVRACVLHVYVDKANALLQFRCKHTLIFNTCKRLRTFDCFALFVCICVRVHVCICVCLCVCVLRRDLLDCGIVFEKPSPVTAAPAAATTTTTPEWTELKLQEAEDLLQWHCANLVSCSLYCSILISQPRRQKRVVCRGVLILE